MNGSLPDPIIPHATVRIVREQTCRFEVMLMKLHLTELEYVVLGHMPQFEVLTKYCTPNMFAEMEFHIKVSWSVLISESVIFGDSKISTKDVQLHHKLKNFIHAYLPDGVPICLLPTICPLLLAHSIVLPNKSSLILTRSCEVKDPSATETL